jgi:Rrf2 family cysteine metabolism transcriptional repressor
MLSQKCQYAIRAIFELARQYGQGPVKISEIAEAQAIPARFLEVILNQLRRGGFVQSKRGPEGGYLLARQPDRLAVGEIVQFMEGPLVPVACMTDKSTGKCSLHGNCVFIGMWKRAARALSEVYDRTSFQNLVDDDETTQQANSISYSI